MFIQSDNTSILIYVIFSRTDSNLLPKFIHHESLQSHYINIYILLWTSIEFTIHRYLYTRNFLILVMWRCGECVSAHKVFRSYPKRRIFLFAKSCSILSCNTLMIFKCFQRKMTSLKVETNTQRLRVNYDQVGNHLVVNTIRHDIY